MLEFLETPLTVLHIVVSLFLVLVILIQPGKSGGLGAALGGAGAQQVFGGRGAGNFLSRMTWISAGIFFMTSVLLAYISSSTEDSLADRRKPVDVEQLSVIKPEPKTAPEGAAQGNAPSEPVAPSDLGAAEQAAGDAPKPETTDDVVSEEAPAKGAAASGSEIEDAPKKGAPKAPAVPGPKVPRVAEPKAPAAPVAPVAPQAASPKAPEAPKVPTTPVAPKPDAPAPAAPTPAAP